MLQSIISKLDILYTTMICVNYSLIELVDNYLFYFYITSIFFILVDGRISKK
jgi:hypothetical protein